MRLKSLKLACSLVLGEVLGRGAVHTANHDVVALVRLQGDALHGAELLLLELFDLLSVHNLGGLGRIDAASLDRDHKVASVLDEHASVEAEDTGLIGLGDVGEDHINHGYEHSVLLGVSGVLNDGDDVGSLLGHVDEITAGSLGELDGVDGSLLFIIERLISAVNYIKPLVLLPTSYYKYY